MARRNKTNFGDKSNSQMDKGRGKYLNSSMSKDNLITLSGNFPINTRLGAEIFGATDITKFAYSKTPLAADIGFTYGVGWSNDPLSPANRAAFYTWQWAIYGSSRTVTFSKEDLFIYEVCVASAYMMLEWMKRVYRYLNYTSSVNIGVPRSILKALHIADNLQDELRSNRARFCDFINKYANDLNVYPLPKSFQAASRWMNMVSRVYKDADVDDDFCQFVSMTPLSVYSWAVDEETGSYADPQLFPSLFSSYSQLTTFMSQFLDSLRNDDDVGRICAQINQTYGPNVYSAVPLSFDEADKPEFFPDFNRALANATVMPVGDTELANSKITQDPVDGGIIYTPQMSNVIVPFQFYNAYGALLDAEGVNTPLDWYVKTTWTAIPSGFSDTRLQCAGMEIIRRVKVVDRTLDLRMIDSFPYAVNLTTPNRNATDFLKNEDLLNKFTYMPRRFAYDTESTSKDMVYISGDLTKYTIIDPVDLNPLHEARILNELGFMALSGQKSVPVDIKQ